MPSDHPFQNLPFSSLGSRLAYGVVVLENWNAFIFRGKLARVDAQLS